MHTGGRHFLRSGWHRLAIISSTASVIAFSAAALGIENVNCASFLVDTLTLARCLDMIRLLGQITQFNEIFEAMARVLPSIKGQAAVIFFLMHVTAWAGMFLWGGEISQVKDPWEGSEEHYWLLNFNTYYESMVTLFTLVVVNNWNLVAEGYYALEINGGIWVYWYFIIFNVIMVTVAMRRPLHDQRY